MNFIDIGENKKKRKRLFRFILLCVKYKMGDRK